MDYPPLRNLKVGDRVRLVHFPAEYLPAHTLHADTRLLYHRLLERRARSVRVCKIDDDGLPWIQCQFRGDDGGWDYHYLLIGTESGWTRVRPRRKAKH